jgi:hypothetical protein
MITGFSILGVEGWIESSEALAKQRFPKFNIDIDKVAAEGAKLKIGYSFKADYMDSDAKDAKNVGSIKLKGAVEVADSKDAINTIVESWTKTRRLPAQMEEEILNGLNFRCGATGTLVAYSLGLIPPIVISSIKIQEQQQK